MNKLIIYCFCIFVFASGADASGVFPSEEELKAHLHRGMTMEQIVAAYGEAGNQMGPRNGKCVFNYLAPLGLRTAQREGYIGFEVQFDQGRVSGWRSFRGNPSYEPPHVPSEVKWIGKFYLILFVCLVIFGLLVRRGRSFLGELSLVKAFNDREIVTEEMPVEFRFINHETTLQEVIDRVGVPTRMKVMPVDSRQIRGSRLIETNLGKPAIIVAEYELPNQAAVVLVPEYPFTSENRIRTAHYRKALPDVESLKQNPPRVS
ncbi:MAG: hypothetical protein WCE87_00925 [Candidatus Udaeobacter sp.]